LSRRRARRTSVRRRFLIASPPDRRTILAALAAASASGLSGCWGQTNRRQEDGGLNIARLQDHFPAIAARAAPGRFNLGVISTRDDRVWMSDSVSRFPLAGSMKVALAAAVLSEVDAGRLSLGQRLIIRATDLSPPPSRINIAWPPPAPNNVFTVPLVDLIALAVQEQDNTASDVLMQRIGGPGAVTAWLESKGIKELRVDRYQRQIIANMSGMESFRSAWKNESDFLAARDAIPAPVREAAMNAYLTDPRDTATAPGALNFLDQLVLGRLLSPASTGLLMRLMSSGAGPARLSAGLPRHVAFAHITGSGLTDLGLTPAANDMGVVTLRNGHVVAIAAFLDASVATQAQRDALFADAARLVMSAFR